MHLRLQPNHNGEIRELHGMVPVSSAPSVTDPKALSTWVAKSMVHLPWPLIDDNCDLHYHAFFPHHRRRVPSRSYYVS